MESRRPCRGHWGDLEWSLGLVSGSQSGTDVSQAGWDGGLPTGQTDESVTGRVGQAADWMGRWEHRINSGRADILRVVWTVEVPCGHLSSLDMDDQPHAQFGQ